MISYKQELWLNQQGGRTVEDVAEQENIQGVYMSVPEGWTFTELPSEENLILKRRWSGGKYPKALFYVTQK